MEGWSGPLLAASTVGQLSYRAMRGSPRSMSISLFQSGLTSLNGLALSALLVPLPVEGVAQSTTDDGPETSRIVPSLVAGLLSGEISVDGRLDDAAWASAPVASGFIQLEPVEGDPAVHDTQVRILIGSDAIYIGARMLDSEPQPNTDKQLFLS